MGGVGLLARACGAHPFSNHSTGAAVSESLHDHTSQVMWVSVGCRSKFDGM